MKKVSLILSLLFILFSSIDLYSKNPEISVSVSKYGKHCYIDVYVPQPQFDLRGISYGTYPLTKIDDDIYDSFHGARWLYNKVYMHCDDNLAIYLKVGTINKYGKVIWTDWGKIGTISRKEIEKYESKSYFRGRVSDIVFNKLIPYYRK